MNIAECKNAVKAAVISYLCKDENGKYIISQSEQMPLYIEGVAGIGKSDIVGQVANELNIGLVSYSIVHHTKNSLLGLPVIKEDNLGRKHTEYTVSEIIASVEKARQEGKEEGILFLDELNSMSDSIAPIMLSLLQRKTIGMYTLPEGWVIVGCGNSFSHNKSVKQFDFATLDRLRKIDVEYSFDAYMEYAKEQGLHPAISDYLTIHKKDLYFAKKAQEKVMEIITCRGWSNLSKNLWLYEKNKQEINEDFVYQFIKSREVAARFYDYYKNVRRDVSLNEINEIVMKGADVCMIQRIGELEDLDKWRITNTIKEALFNRLHKGMEDKPVDYEKCANQVGNVLAFLKAIDDSDRYLELIIDGINADNELIKIAVNVDIPLYNSFVKNKYGVA